MASSIDFSESQIISALTSSIYRRYSSGEIAEATNNFDPSKIFSSGFDFNEYVANISYYDADRKSKSISAYVKRYKTRHNFLKEAITVIKIHHTNLMSLLGYCIEFGENILVYKYMENGRLEDYLNNKDHTFLHWTKRVKICLHVAYGLEQLHRPTTDFPRGIAHGSVNPTNILLDENLDAKLTYFSGRVTTRSQDAYKFGSVLVNVLCWNNPEFEDGFYTNYDEHDIAGLAQKYIALESESKHDISPDSLNAYAGAIRKCLSPSTYDQPPYTHSAIDGVVLDLAAALKFQELFQDPQPIPTTLDLINSSSSTSFGRRESRIMGGVSEADSLDDFNSSSSYSFSLNSSSSSSSLGLFDACQQFSLDEIKMATNNFDMEKCLGKGGEATVYRGEIYLHRKTEKSIVAVKHLEKGITRSFEKEIATVAKFRHPNIVSLFGYCKESDEKVLIYEYMGKGSLSDYVKMNSKVCLSWKQRLNICLDAAKGLLCLHTETDEFPKGIIHRDVKPENILIDDNWVAKVSDFGMLKLSKVSQTNSIMSTLNIKGTPGYFAPESFYFKKLSKKIDVYAFGFVMFEVLCRKKRWEIFVDKSIYLEDDNDVGLLVRENIDSTIKHEIADSSLQVFIDIIVESMQYDPKERPTMDKVVLKLEEALKCQENSDD